MTTWHVHVYVYVATAVPEPSRYEISICLHSIFQKEEDRITDRCISIMHSHDHHQEPSTAKTEPRDNTSACLDRVSAWLAGYS